MGKFTKEQAIKALEAKIPTKDKELDLARTISEAVDNSLELIGEDSEMELDVFVEKVFKQVKTSIGLTHSENSKVANKMQTAIDDLQKKLEGKGDGGGKGGEDTDPQYKALQDELTKIRERLAKEDSEKTINTKRAEIAAKMKESIKDEEWINAYLAEIAITEQTDVEAKAKDYVAFYNKTQAKGGHITPKPADGGNGGDNYVKSTVAAAANFKKQTSAGSPVQSKTVTNN